MPQSVLSAQEGASCAIDTLHACAVTEGRLALRLIPGDTDADRWTNEGGSFGSEVTLPLPATAATR